MIKISAVLVLVLSILVACSLVESPESKVGVYLTDRPLKDVESLEVYIDGASYHYETDSTALTVNVELSTTVDLVSLAGEEMELFEMDIPEGATLVWISLNIEDATVTISGEEYPVKVVGKDVKIMIHQVISDGDLILDFDVSRSLVEAGSPFHPFYILKPVLVPFVGHGSHPIYTVEGKVYEDGEPVFRALVALLDEDSTSLRTTLTRRDGSFRIRGVKSGEYELYVFSNPSILSGGDLLDELDSADYSTDVSVDDSDVDLGVIDLNTSH